MTPTFEHPVHRAVENAVLRSLRETWPIEQAHHLPEFKAADWAIRIREPRELVLLEVKGQNRRYQDRPFVKTGLKKIEPLIELASSFGASRAILMVVMLYERSMWTIDADKIDRTVVEWGGRTERAGSKNDKEWMVLIPIGDLSPVKGYLDGGVCDEAIAYNVEQSERARAAM